MKHKALLPTVIVALWVLCHSANGTATAQTPFQLPNPGFESWDGDIESEPTHWNTFSSSDGSYSTLASSNHHYRRAGHRPGGTGNYYLTIYTKSIIGIKANGNMTTGRIHAGSTSASSSDNYNYTQRSNADHSQPFTATPDSMYVWVSFYAADAASTAQVSAIIHGNNDFRAPNQEDEPALYAGRAVAHTTRTTSSASQMQWTQLRVPFVYDGAAPPTYILVNLTTNNIPGSGEKNDSLSVDDIEFIYSAWLNDISIAGSAVPDFWRGHLDYTVHVDNLAAIDTAAIVCHTQAPDAHVEKSLVALNDSTVQATLTVTAEDGQTQRTYRLTLTTATLADIASPNSRPALRLYPNPAQQQFTIDAQGTATVTDLMGHTVMKLNCFGPTTVTHHLPRGTYLVTCGGASTKLIVQ